MSRFVALRGKRRQAVAALIEHRSVESAARAVGISSRTLWRWLSDPVFRGEYEAACGEAFARAMNEIQSLSQAAVEVLHSIMKDEDASEGARIRAADIVLESAARWRDTQVLERRIAELEERLSEVMLDWRHVR